MKVTFFQLRLDTLLIRFYLLMAVIIVALFTEVAALALLALPIFLSAILGVEISLSKNEIATQSAVLAPQKDSKTAA